MKETVATIQVRKDWHDKESGRSMPQVAAMDDSLAPYHISW